MKNKINKSVDISLQYQKIFLLLCIDKLDDIVNEYKNTYRTVKIKSDNVNSIY